jgi:arginase
MSRILVPYHLEERLDDLDVPVAADVVVTAPPVPDRSASTPDDPWATMAALYELVAGDVAGDVATVAGGGQRPVMVFGDCTTSAGTLTGLRRAGLDPSIVWFDGHAKLAAAG